MKTALARPSRKVDIYHYFKIMGSMNPWSQQQRVLQGIYISRLPNPEPGIRAYMLDSNGSLLLCELSGEAVWVISVDTLPSMRRHGSATKLLRALIDYAARTHKTFVPGIYTNMGKRYLRPKVNRMCQRKGVPVYNHT